MRLYYEGQENKRQGQERDWQGQERDYFEFWDKSQSFDYLHS